MRTIYDPTNRWVGASPLILSSSNKKPVAIDDELDLFVGSGPITVTVLDNDFDPEGATLSLISASAALGTAVAEANNTITYTPPPGLSGFDTIVYEIADDLDQRNVGQVNVTINEASLSIDVLANNTLEVNAETGPLQIVVNTPAEFAGTFAMDTAELVGGPVNLVAPTITGVPGVGASLNANRGLWVQDTGSGTLNKSWQWLLGGAEITGETSASYTMTAADVGSGVSVRETLTDDFGQRNANSAPVSLFFTPNNDSALVGWWDASDVGTIVSDAGFVSAWNDKSGGTALTQTLSNRQPITNSRTMNGLNALDFDGNDFVQRAGSFPVSGDVAFHMALAIDSTINAFEAILAVEGSDDFQIDAENAAQFDGRLNLTGMGTAFSFSGGPYSGPLILSAVFDHTGAGTAEIFINNVSRGSTAYTTAIDVFGDLLLMTNRSKNAWVNGAVGELVVTGNVSNRAAYHTYLSDKWGVS